MALKSRLTASPLFAFNQVNRVPGGFKVVQGVMIRGEIELRPSADEEPFPKRVRESRVADIFAVAALLRAHVRLEHFPHGGVIKADEGRFLPAVV